MPLVHIIGRGALSAAGPDPSSLGAALAEGRATARALAGLPVHALDEAAEGLVAAARRESRWRGHDRATVMAVVAARKAWAEAGLGRGGAEAGVVFGASRGISEAWESAHAKHVGGERIHPATSPVTTPSAIPAAVSHAVGAEGPSLFVSAACCTGLHAIGLAAGMIAAGQASVMVAGGTEAPLTPFTLGMLDATKVMAPLDTSEPFPCRPWHEARRGMVMGEGAAAVVLATADAAPEGGGACVAGFAAANEDAGLAGLSADGAALQRAVRRALAQAGVAPSDVSLVVGHGSSTARGDAAEAAAYRAVFGDAMPPLVFHKWLTGHALGASAALSVVAAVDHLRDGRVPGHPYVGNQEPDPWQLRDARRMTSARHVLVTALGFGGNAAALVLAKA